MLKAGPLLLPSFTSSHTVPQGRRASQSLQRRHFDEANLRLAFTAARRGTAARRIAGIPSILGYGPFDLSWLQLLPSRESMALRLMKRIDLAYELHPTPRNGGAANVLLHEIISSGTGAYIEHLEYFISIRDEFFAIRDLFDASTPTMPHWDNGFLPGLDIVSLHGLLRRHNPETYLEVGSGNSTKVARRCIEMHKLQTKIVSIDPHPRAEVDAICDRVLRTGFEEAGLEQALALKAGDFLFFDGTHYAYMNSDTTVFFLEVLPRLKPGVLVQVHDICLPYDYPAEWSDRFYSEQYLLASALLFGADRFSITLPNTFISQDPQLWRPRAKLWDDSRLRSVAQKAGVSFWFSVHEASW